MKQPKYRAIPTTVDNIRFASKKEAKRYGELKLLQQAGEIAGLEMQPRWDLHVNGTRVAFYKGDFCYIAKGGLFVVEDVKGMRTPMYRLKRKMMLAEHGIEIKEI